ncbi:MAG TPA: polysaccharide pyruvyl transferase family protein [Thermoanaerobaculia bacterium]|nr:polysaccharide pyruvyl transferase family protein [Thermoanaerobaculia bacterium]
MRVLILGGDVDGNLGDRALLTGMCDDLRSSGWPVEVTTTSSRSGQNGHDGLDVRALRRGVRGFAAMRGAAARADLVLWGGGGLLQDDDSLLKVPYWATLLTLLRPVSRYTVAYALGVGPLRRSASRLLAGHALGRCDAISARDRLGQTLAAKLSSLPVSLVPDPALLLRPAPRPAALEWLREREVPRDGRPIVGVALRRWFPPRDRLVPHQHRPRFVSSPEQRAPEAERLIDNLARCLSRIAKELGAHLLFLPSYAIEVEGDVEICQRVLTRSGAKGQIEVIRDPRVYAAIVGELQLVVGGRMHPTILAASAGTPVVGIGYNPKFDGFFELLDSQDLQLPVERVVGESGAEELEGVMRAALERGPPSPARVERLRQMARRFNRELLGSFA